MIPIMIRFFMAVTSGKQLREPMGRIYLQKTAAAEALLLVKGTVQSKIVLHAIPWSRMEGETAGSLEGSRGWQRTPGMVMMSVSP